jgi:hypothetical protein
MSLDLVAN